MNKHQLSTIYGWQNCPESVRRTLNDIITYYRQTLGKNLVGFYLHGSLSMGCFNPSSSDLDFLAVVQRNLPIDEKKAIIDYLLHNCDLHTEMSIVTIESIKNMEYPTPFELHYNHDHREQYRNGMVDLTVKRYDKDMALHFEVLRQRGICLYGKSIDEVFPEVSRELCIASLNNELRWINERFNTLPVTYIVLNPCRALAFLSEGRFMSKKEGGEWALTYLPAKFHDTISRALAIYIGAEDIEHPGDDILHDIVDYAREEIIQYLEKHR
ncbi:MAG: DUF4111 domain-containing protein [Dehalococcoidales bacterium]|nr:DUF4111 domain-containing protein [Dehalococcoidales bacterium]